MDDFAQDDGQISYKPAGRWRTGSRAETDYGSPHEREQPRQRPRLQAPLLLPGDGGRPAPQRAAEEALEALDLRSLNKVPADYVGDDFRQRHGATVWRVRAAGDGGGWAYVLVLLEYQSSNDATMALRVAEYTTMLYRELLRAKALEAGPLPPVLPIVLYNGESP